jgi:hypothetical protein
MFTILLNTIFNNSPKKIITSSDNKITKDYLYFTLIKIKLNLACYLTLFTLSIILDLPEVFILFLIITNMMNFRWGCPWIAIQTVLAAFDGHLDFIELVNKYSIKINC